MTNKIEAFMASTGATRAMAYAYLEDADGQYYVALEEYRRDSAMEEEALHEYAQGTPANRIY